ncbi:hypothetical protein NHQ30_001638 [Ciborinia camelliae]|nr:hypothetical protein NHQ30_001638 [Ciborinia camelliae]
MSSSKPSSKLSSSCYLEDGSVDDFEVELEELLEKCQSGEPFKSPKDLIEKIIKDEGPNLLKQFMPLCMHEKAASSESFKLPPTEFTDTSTHKDTDNFHVDDWQIDVHRNWVGLSRLCPRCTKTYEEDVAPQLLYFVTAMLRRYWSIATQKAPHMGRVKSHDLNEVLTLFYNEKEDDGEYLKIFKDIADKEEQRYREIEEAIKEHNESFEQEDEKKKNEERIIASKRKAVTPSCIAWQENVSVPLQEDEHKQRTPPSDIEDFSENPEKDGTTAFPR